MITKKELYIKLKEKGLKVTPQRIAVLDVLVGNTSHPNAESLIKLIRNNNPSISTGTIYSILDTFVSKGVIRKILTEGNIMRYDPSISIHHHIHIKETNEVIDFFDDNLSKIVSDYLLKNSGLSEIEIDRIDISIIGNRKKEKK
jgi:Fur family peroxide stress response transcriptional regulator